MVADHSAKSPSFERSGFNSLEKSGLPVLSFFCRGPEAGDADGGGGGGDEMSSMWKDDEIWWEMEALLYSQKYMSWIRS